MNILYLLLFYPPPKFCQLDVEGHRKTQSIFIGVIVLRAIQLYLNASAMLSFFMENSPTPASFRRQNRCCFPFAFFPSAHCLECGPIRMLLSENCLDIYLFMLNSLAVWWAGLTHKNWETMNYFKYFLIISIIWISYTCFIQFSSPNILL